ncbi:SHOCT domain-containing protein [Streptomyces sp. NPDC048290]|uniref:SHOCT domain-containing protein n=1 Tax=Streptomyces sp. NPDC048290 TaxID=3155811 RepID=UPI00344107D4
MSGRYRSDFASALERATDLDDTRWTRKNIRNLELLMWPQEAVEVLTVGRALGSLGPRKGLVAVTSSRVIYAKAAMLAFQSTTPVSVISSVTWADGRLSIKWPVDAGLTVAEVPARSGSLLAEHLQAKVEKQEREEESRTERPGRETSADDVARRLEVLDRLRESGAITEAESQERRRAILDNI